MASPNFNPRFTLNANIGNADVIAANTRSDGQGTIGVDMSLLFSPGAQGSFLELIQVMPVATVAGTLTAATTARVYLSSVNAGVTTSADTHLIAEVTLPAVNADSAAAAQNAIQIPIGRNIPAGTFVLVSIHVAAAANTSWQFVAWGGNY